MPEIRLTYWWNDRAPGDVVEVDEVTARALLGTIAKPVRAGKPADGGTADKPRRGSRTEPEESGD
jgi:hypothetical protein